MRRLAAVIAGVALGAAVMLPFGSPSRANVSNTTLNPHYLHYNFTLLARYLREQIGYETLRRMWLGGAPPSQALIDATENELGLSLFQGQTPHHQIRAEERQAAAVTGTYTFASVTPGLPFVGNQTVILGATPFANDTNLTAVGLRRSGDCTLVEDILEPVNNSLVNSSVLELANAQNYLHTLSGLATVPGTYPKGCDAPETGHASIFTSVVVGVTAGGIEMVADLNPTSGVLEVQETTSAGVESTLTLGTAEASGLLSVDLNGDGNDDLIVSDIVDPATSQKSLVVYLNNGDGTFQAAKYFDAPAYRFLIDDINGDGKPDLVASVYAGGVVTLLGKGDGTFQAAVASATSVTPTANALLSGDFDGDGKIDLLMGTTVLKGAGDGTFTAMAALPAAQTHDLGSAYSAVAGDVNNDGKLDVVYTSSAGYFVQILLGNGDGTFSTGARYASLPTGQQITLTDIDGDGNLDIAVGGDDKGLFVQDLGDGLNPEQQIMLGRGDGSFAGAPMYASNTAIGGALGVLSHGLSSSGGADFNGDGKLDVLTVSSGTGTGPGALSLLPGDGTGLLGAAINSTVQEYPTALATGDFDGDGKLDAVVIGNAVPDATPRLALLKGQGDGHFAGEQDYALSNLANGLAIGDFNGDGHLDVAVGVQPQVGSTGDSGVYVLFGKADGTLATPVKIDASRAPSGIESADLNGDGRADLVITDEGVFASDPTQRVSGAVHIYFGNADGTFTAAPSPVTAATNYLQVKLGDLNGDGKPDLILSGATDGGPTVSYAPAVYTLLGNGDGTFKAAVATPLLGTDGFGATALVVADFNGDGHLDVATANTQDYTEILFGQGDGTLVKTVLALGQLPADVGAVDLNGDGMPDLLLSLNGGVGVFMNVPKTSWVPPPGSSTAAAATTTTLTASAASAAAGQSVTLTASVASTATGTPTGTVTFYDGATALGTGTLAQGTATFSSSSLAAGAHSLTAQYGGDSTFAASTSAAVAFTVNAAAAADFAIAVSPGAASVAAGQTATTTIALTPSGGFSGAVTLSCSGLPAGTSCSFAPASITLNGAPASSTLTIATVARVALLAVPGEPGKAHTGWPGEPLLAVLVAPPVLRGRRRRRGRGVGFALVLGALVLVAACHDDHAAQAPAAPAAGGTAAGAYTITVTAAGGGVSHAARYALTVT